MTATRQDRKDNSFAIYDRVDALRTDYVRELSGLSKIFIAISSAMLGLTLAPLAPDLFTKVGVRWLVWTWIALAITAALGFVQVFFFSSRFKAKADYLWTSHLRMSCCNLTGPRKRSRSFQAKPITTSGATTVSTGSAWPLSWLRVPRCLQRLSSLPHSYG